MAKATIRFNSEKSAKSFAERTNGNLITCHGKEASRFKVQVNRTESHGRIEQPLQKPDGTSGSEWDNYAWGGDDY
jgi:hypothetical protein